MNLYNNVTLITANFNKATLTRAMLMSLLKKGVLPRITIIDNSNSEFYDLSEAERSVGISLIDNRHYRLTKNWGVGELSKNHAHSLDYALGKVQTEWAVICDNDILFRPSIIEIFDSLNTTQYDVIGEVGFDAVRPDRLFPYLCFIRMDIFKKYSVQYFDPDRCMALGHDEHGSLCHLYDTGYSFYEDIQKYPINLRRITLDDYCVHYLHASQNEPNGKPPLPIWLDQHRELY